MAITHEVPDPLPTHATLHQPPKQDRITIRTSSLSTSIAPAHLLLQRILVGRAYTSLPEICTHLLAEAARTQLVASITLTDWPTIRPKWRRERRKRPHLAALARAAVLAQLERDYGYAEAQRLLARGGNSDYDDNDDDDDGDDGDDDGGLEQRECMAYMEQRWARIHAGLDEAEAMTATEWGRKAACFARARAEEWVKWYRAAERRYDWKRSRVQEVIERRVLALGLETGEEFDADRWGQRVRVEVLTGRKGKGDWPCQRLVEVYKRRKYGRKGGCGSSSRPRPWPSPVYQPSPLARFWS
ncbi:hypothetical protein MFIFM68171_06075 [Madurella fahalii]|uniref:Uncharacterized protein n=1 Tax=Madurella fahalii TaxID=1157608 RepID=A0ABQ0GDW2_9PEZI